MASIRQILQRKKAVSNIHKVTRTMEMISTSRYRKYLQRYRSGRRFYNSLAELAFLMLTGIENIESPLVDSNDSGVLAVLVIGADRGLNGGFNSQLNHMIEVHIKRAKRLRKELKLYVCGKKPTQYLRQRGIKPEKEFTGIDGIPSLEQADAMSDEFIEMYLKKEIDYFGVVYTNFYSLASQKPQTLSILPVADLIDDLTTRATVIWPWTAEPSSFETEPASEDMFEALARIMIRTAVAECFVDSALSDHLARVVAMKSATDSAEDMIADLNAEYNRARQGSITNDLIDIIGGTLALE
ncbi:MAG: ATP synthase F1 subunit gamma [Phycisphaerae bacterium]|jgi:F-type H+-transporting ATPase subunit gamma